MPNLKELIVAAYEKQELVSFKFGEFDCFVKKWTEKERIEYVLDINARLKANDGNDEQANTKTIAYSLCDADGVSIFDPKKDLETIGRFPCNLVSESAEAIIGIQNDRAKKN